MLLQPYVNACTRFVYLDEPTPLPQPDVPLASQLPASVAVLDSPGRISGNVLKQDKELMNLRLDNLAQRARRKGWALLSEFGDLLSKETDFSQRKYGYRRLCDFLGAIDLFELKQTQQGVRVRQRP